MTCRDGVDVLYTGSA